MNNDHRKLLSGAVCPSRVSQGKVVLGEGSDTLHGSYQVAGPVYSGPGCVQPVRRTEQSIITCWIRWQGSMSDSAGIAEAAVHHCGCKLVDYCGGNP